MNTFIIQLEYKNIWIFNGHRWLFTVDLGKIAFFSATHPNKIKELVLQQKRELEETSKSFDSLYGKLASDFNLLMGKPNVQFFEGKDGLKHVYDDILENTQPYS